MAYTTTLRTIETQNFTVELQVVETQEGSNWLADLYTPTDEHIGGTTIQVPDRLQDRHAPKYYIGQYTPAELARDFARQGRANPSAEAYKALQDELGHYITADDCFLQCVVSGAGMELGRCAGITFDYSRDYALQSLEDTALSMLKEHGRGFIRDAITEARDQLQVLKAIA